MKYLCNIKKMVWLSCLWPHFAVAQVTITQTITSSQTIPVCTELRATNTVQIGATSKVNYYSTGVVSLQPGFTVAVTGNASFLAKNTSACAGTPVEEPIVVKVLVIVFNPTIENGKKVIQYYNYKDPVTLAAEYMKEVSDASKGYVKHAIVNWRDKDAFPVMDDGFQYNATTYKQCMANKNTCHTTSAHLDYVKLVNDEGIATLINNNTIDEVWVFGGPYFGFWEFAMAGPGAFNINGGIYPNVATNRPFAIMGPNYERGHTQMFHNLCHRAEKTMSRIYGNWDPYNQKRNNYITNWDKFTAIEQEVPGKGGVGYCHQPVNGFYRVSSFDEYKYDTVRFVTSTANDWVNYPNLSGLTSQVNRTVWGDAGQNDYELGYLRWWFRLMPWAAGTNPDTKQNNWWKYIYNFNAYSAQGIPLNSIVQIPAVETTTSKEAESRFKLLNNPVKGQLTFTWQFTGRETYTLAGLYTPDGQLIQVRKIHRIAGQNATRVEWLVSGLPPGIYLLKAGEPGNPVTQKIVKE